MNCASRLPPRRQGELGELSAIEWLGWYGAIVFTPVGHSPDVDLIADFGSGPIRVEVKTSTHRNGNGWSVPISTSGGNQSWNRIVKHFDPERCDYVFVHVGDGRRWFVPTHAISSRRSITLGGRKYAEYEIEPGKPLANASPLQSRVPLGECQSGQMERAVNASAMPTEVRILPPPSALDGCYRSPSGELTVWAKRRVTLPLHPWEAAGFAKGDRLRARADGDGRMILERIAAGGGGLDQPELTTPAEPESEEAA